ncbi:MAG TPA: SPFH domain-containing protein [Tahibacter sp.]|uniref:SPFH domain-containing protein n=1 Tax=Tahibacter sp. TaxID=2056211 RepID=UPI002D14D7A2|nr:SPFH domain-containing protein [Tahibacter sp.]HSX59433.1 SPFH domain-containing protein [Tahibacter sp.]
MSPSILFLVLSAAVAVILLSVKRIPEGTVYTLRRFNGQARMLQSGTHLIWPLLERVVHRISLTGHVLTLDELFPLADAGMRLSGKIYWQVIDAQRADATIDRADALIRGRLLNAARAIDNPAEESPESRNSRLKAALNESLRNVGIVVTRVQVTLA